MTLFRGVKVFKKVFGILMTQIPHSLDETNKDLSQPSGFLVKVRLSSTRAAYSDIRHMKESTRLKQPHCRGAERSRRLKFECP
jgi:hypothetical protein